MSNNVRTPSLLYDFLMPSLHTALRGLSEYPKSGSLLVRQIPEHHLLRLRRAEFRYAYSVWDDHYSRPR